MTPDARRREPFVPPTRERRTGALVLSVLAHALLVAALAFGVHWHNSEPTRLAAELWSAVPKVGARPSVAPAETAVTRAPPPEPAPAPAPAPTPAPAPQPVPAPRPPPPAEPDPQIAIEQQRRAAARAEAERAAEQQRQLRAQEQERQRAAQEQQRKLAQEAKAKAEAQQAAVERADKAQAAAIAAERAKNLQRIAAMAGGTGRSDTATALHDSGPSDSYAGRIRARIKPHIVFSDDVPGNPKATVEVTLAPDGTIIGKRLLHSSGVKTWDDAVLRAIDSTGELPRDIDGRVRSPIEIGFSLRD